MPPPASPTPLSTENRHGSHAAVELGFGAYQARQLDEITRAALWRRAAALRPGGRFHRNGSGWTPAPYPGHAVVTMLAASPLNEPLAGRASALRDAILDRAALPDALCPLPSASFHQTIANTLSDDRHRELVVGRGLSSSFPASVAGAFATHAAPLGTVPPAMTMVGVSLFGTALGLLGTFSSESDFQRILAARDAFYRDARVAALGIRRTRPFIGHITLAYLERPLSGDDQERLVEAVDSLNRAWAAEPPSFHLPFAELRAYDHLAEFRHLPGLPSLAL